MTLQSNVCHFLTTEFPQNECIVELVNKDSARVRKPINSSHLRPGNTIAGPAIMDAADFCLYVAVLGATDIKGMSATTNLSFNFLRKPDADRDLIALCELIKIGKRIITGKVAIYSEGKSDMVAHAIGSYYTPIAPD